MIILVYLAYSSRNLEGCGSFGRISSYHGRSTTVGQLSSSGVPMILYMISNCDISSVPLNTGFPVKNSSIIHLKIQNLNFDYHQISSSLNKFLRQLTYPTLHISTAGPYAVAPSNSSGGRYHNVMTRLV